LIAGLVLLIVTAVVAVAFQLAIHQRRMSQIDAAEAVPRRPSDRQPPASRILQDSHARRDRSRFVTVNDGRPTAGETAAVS
jgi:hypothetical protein